MKLKVTVDRIENNIAVLLIRPEETIEIDWPLKYLPNYLKEGDILDFKISKDIEKRKRKEEKIKNIIDKLQKKDN